MDINHAIQHEQSAWAAKDSLEYYRTHRNRPADLYESERFFLPEVLPHVSEVLDVGCAAGGFSRIMRSFNPLLRYTGVDITPGLIEIAKYDHPDCEFHVSDGIHFPFAPEPFELVHCSGVLHLNSRWAEMLKSMWELTGMYLLFDIRLTRGPSVAGTLSLDLSGQGELQQPLPYYVLNMDEWLLTVRSLVPMASSVRAKGYTHAVSAMARLPIEQVIMATCLLTKGMAQESKVEVLLDD
jgi:SAM-dependent methyltransferase